MRSRTVILRKATKRAAQRKDFIRRKNMNRNVPTLAVEKKKEVYRPVMAKGKAVLQYDGKPKLEHVGYKTVIEKLRMPRLHLKDDQHEHRIDSALRAIPMIEYPMPRKVVPAGKK